MTQFTVFQLDSENSKVARDIQFMGYDFVKENNINLTLDLYKKVYEGTIHSERSEFFDNSTEICDHIYLKLNFNHPADFKGHSLSVSDIVMINGRYFYCDDHGWTEVKFPKQTKTYKVTYFTKELDVENVITYHNIGDQGFLLDTIATNIYTLELAEVVKCETAEENYTVAVNELIKGRLAKLAA